MIRRRQLRPSNDALFSGPCPFLLISFFSRKTILWVTGWDVRRVQLAVDALPFSFSDLFKYLNSLSGIHN